MPLNRAVPLELGGAIFHGTSDTEIIAYIITQQRLKPPPLRPPVSCAMYQMEGAYSLVMMSSAKLIAARDPWGFRRCATAKPRRGCMW